MVTCSNADADGPCVIQCYIAAQEYFVGGHTELVSRMNKPEWAHKQWINLSVYNDIINPRRVGGHGL